MLRKTFLSNYRVPILVAFAFAFLASMPCVAPLAADEIDDYVAKQLERQNIRASRSPLLRTGR
ncbi:MAG TPA: hypothetical protein VFB63_00950 [Bryobacteraceae bacterium]|nr:hypothetical protein [Bryobacteraceae bacterium]